MAPHLPQEQRLHFPEFAGSLRVSGKVCLPQARLHAGQAGHCRELMRFVELVLVGIIFQVKELGMPDPVSATSYLTSFQSPFLTQRIPGRPPLLVVLDPLHLGHDLVLFDEGRRQEHCAYCANNVVCHSLRTADKRSILPWKRVSFTSFPTDQKDLAPSVSLSISLPNSLRARRILGGIAPSPASGTSKVRAPPSALI